MNVEALGFQCGGMKGLAYVGALTQLEMYGMDISKIKLFAGTGTGAQIAALLAFGYKPNELKNLLKENIQSQKVDSSVVVKSYKLLKRKLSFSDKNNKGYIDAMLTERSGNVNTSFIQLYKKRKVHLRITGTCLTTGELEYFDYKLTPYMSVSTAIQISGACPFYNSAVKYNHKYYVDGGLICKIPIDVFDANNMLFLELIDSTDMEKHNEINNIFQFAYAMVNTTSKYCNRLITTNHGDKVNIIKIDAPTIPKNEKVDEHTKLHMIQQGKHAVSLYMQRGALRRMMQHYDKTPPEKVLPEVEYEDPFDYLEEQDPFDYLEEQDPFKDDQTTVTEEHKTVAHKNTFHSKFLFAAIVAFLCMRIMYTM